MDRRAFLTAAAACGLTPRDAFAQASPPSPPPPAPRPYRRFDAAAAYSALRQGAAFVVARNGIVIGEDYAVGAPGARWRIGSGARVFALLLAASLVKDELMSLDEPVALSIGDWGADPQKSMISIRALLNGTSGIAFNQRGDDLATAITMAPAAAPGERFIEDAAPYVLLTEIARRKLLNAGRNPDPAAYLTERTLLPIGCVPIGWTRGPDGAPRLDDGIAVSARGWAQVGELIRREGVWQAQQLADEETLRQARLATFAESHVGMTLYLASGTRTRDFADSDLWRMSPPAPIDLVMAAGGGGQRLYIIPSQNLVIVRMAQTLDARDWSDAGFLASVFRDL